MQGMSGKQSDGRMFPVLQDKTFLLCVGAAKCATSWLYDYLGSKPEVTVSPLKEVHFFDARYPVNALGDADEFAMTRLVFHLQQAGGAAANLKDRPTFQASVDRARMIYDDSAYFAHFARLCTNETTCCCDLTPAYSAIGAEGFHFVRDFFASQDSNLKLLFLMRDPVDRFWSQLRHMQQMNPDRDVIGNWRNAITSPALLARADYRGLVTTLDRIFPREKLLYLFYEAMFETDHALRDLCSFAELPFSPGVPMRVRNETTFKAAIPARVQAALLHTLRPQYEFCRERFGARIPETWLS